MAKGKCTAKTSLPEYIQERNRAALAAGLTIERQDSYRGRLTTWYRGSEAQWRASVFCTRTKPFNRSAMGAPNFRCFTPDTCARLYVQFRPGEGDYRGSVPREQLPKHSKSLRHGIICYAMVGDRGDRLVYVGEARALIDSKVAPAEIMHQTCNDTGSRWQCSILPDGRYCFASYGESKEAAEPDKDSEYSDPKAFALVQERWLMACAQVTLRHLSGKGEQETNGECTIRYDADTVEQVKDAFDEALRALQGATPKFVGAKATEVKRLQVARANPGFQAFLHRLTDTAAGKTRRGN